MGVKFGEIDISQVLENEYKIGVLEKLLEYLLQNNSTLVKPTPEQINQMRVEVVENLKKKYPNSGISLGKQ